jgi:hypothetical protein
VTRSRYAALWCDNGRTPLAGMVELAAHSLSFEGRSADRQARRQVGYDEIRAVRLTREPRERLRGRPALVLDIGGPEPIRVSSPEPGALHELLDALTVAANAAARTTAAAGAGSCGC